MPWLLVAVSPVSTKRSPAFQPVGVCASTSVVAPTLASTANCSKLVTVEPKMLTSPCETRPRLNCSGSQFGSIAPVSAKITRARTSASIRWPMPVGLSGSGLRGIGPHLKRAFRLDDDRVDRQERVGVRIESQRAVVADGVQRGAELRIDDHHAAQRNGDVVAGAGNGAWARRRGRRTSRCLGRTIFPAWHWVWKSRSARRRAPGRR